jgi:hypothetical protein
VLIAMTGLPSLPRWRASTHVARRSPAPVYLRRWVSVGAIVLWCAASIGEFFTGSMRRRNPAATRSGGRVRRNDWRNAVVERRVVCPTVPMEDV